MKNKNFKLLVENWRKFLKDGVIQESMDDEFESDYSEIDRQEDDYDMEQRMEPYAEDDDTKMDAGEPVNQMFKIGQRVEVHSIEGDDKLQASSEGEAWDNAGIWYGSSGPYRGFEVIVDDYSPDTGYTLVDTEDSESKLYGVSEDNIREVGSGPDYRMSRSYEQDLEDWARNNPYTGYVD